jgi:hypothetical protein
MGNNLRKLQDTTISRKRWNPSPTTAPFRLSICCQRPNNGLFTMCSAWAVSDLSCDKRSTTF